MKQDMWDGELKQSAGTPAHCDRAEDLVTYLYGEANASQAQSFEQHLGRCGSCQAEFAAFSCVRDSVGEWRAALLANMAEAPLTSMVFTAPAVSVPAAASAARSDRPAQEHSTLAALRKLFEFSPLWVRAAGVAAILLICVLAGFIINSQRKTITAGRVTPLLHQDTARQNREAAPQGSFDPTLSARLDENVERSSSTSPIILPPDHEGAASSGRPKRSGRVRPNPTPSPIAAVRNRPLTAADEREAVAREESNLPQLYDLLGERQFAPADEDSSPRLRDLLREID